MAQRHRGSGGQGTVAVCNSCHQPWRRAGDLGPHKASSLQVARNASHWEWFSSFLSLSSCLPALDTKASLICLQPKKELQGLLPRLGGELGFPHSDALLLKVLDLRGQAVVAGHLLTGDVGDAKWPASPSPRCPSTVYRFTLARERGLLCSRLYFSSLLPLVLSESHLRAVF